MTIFKHPPEWHERRRHAIGGSDANIIMAGDPDDLIRLWRVKRGEIPDDDLSDDLPVQVGKATEDLNATWFERKTGLTVSMRGHFQKIGFQSATLDGVIESIPAAFEAKHVGGFEAWDVTIERYYPQLQHILSVTGYETACLSVLIGNHTWRWEKIKSNSFYQEELLEAEKTFWDCVQSGKPPVPLPPVEIPAGEAYRVVDLTSSNLFTISAAEYLVNKNAHKTFEKATDDLKSCIEKDVKIGYGHGIIVKRDQRGYLRITEGTYDAQSRSRKAR